MNSLGGPTIVFITLCAALLTSCANPPPRPAAPPPNLAGNAPDSTQAGTPSNGPGKGETACSAPYRAELGKPFVTVVSLGAGTPKTLIRMGASESIVYKPDQFSLTGGQRMMVDTTVKSSRSGLAVIDAYPIDQDVCEVVVDVGFQGHLKITALPLGYNDPQVLHVLVVDNNEKPLPLETTVSMQVQSADALLNLPGSTKPDQDKYFPLTLEVEVGSTSSSPFIIRSMNRKGGSVHLLATLSLKVDGGVISQNVFTLDAEPVWWLPIALAIGGALIYALYHALQDTTSLTSWKLAIPLRVLTSIVAGVIAYLFADFDLLGLKLDPHVLRTYALLGFLFSFIGIDVLLSKRFK